MRLPSPEAPSDPLQGNWSATRWQYRGAAQHELAIDVVCDLGASVFLSLGADSYVLTYEAPERRTIEGGEFQVSGNILELRPHADGPSKSVSWRLADATLTLRAEQTTYDFDAAHPNEPASLVAVLVRV